MAEKKDPNKKIKTSDRVDALLLAAKKIADEKPTQKSSVNKKTSSGKSSTAKKTASGKSKTSRENSSATQYAVKAVTATVVKSKNTTIKVIAILLVAAILGVLIFGYFWGWFDEWVYAWFYTPSTIVSGELTIHFLELGNKYTGDSIYIKAGDTDILVDAGSRGNSAPVIQKYVDEYCTDGILEFVIATHADQDHIAAFAASNGIFDMYEVETIIDFPKSDKSTQVLQNYRSKRDAEVASGAKHYTALECYNESKAGAQKVWDLTGDGSITLEILYQDYYEQPHNDENNYSVCFLLNHGDRSFLFTGDLEEDGEESLVEKNELPEVELFKAGHHGSKTSSNDVLLEVIKPKIVCVCCCAGSAEYTSNTANQFPTQAMIDRVAVYTSAVYVTTLAQNDGFAPMNGNIRIISTESGVTVNGSNNSLKLYQTDWFKKYRMTPLPWSSLAS